MISDEDRMMMIKEIATTYLINPKTARAYAKRRKNEETLIKVLKTVPLFEKWDFSK
jgi:threonine synthase